jgi:hypothetical protein
VGQVQAVRRKATFGGIWDNKRRGHASPGWLMLHASNSFVNLCGCGTRPTQSSRRTTGHLGELRYSNWLRAKHVERKCIRCI